MQAFDRSEEESPQHLRGPEARKSRERMVDFMQLEQTRRAQTSAPRSTLSLEEPSLTEALSRLFRGKCAFCEAREPTGVHRFRPESEALPFESGEVGHLYYVWLADAWENLYPICRNCRPGEPGWFPVRSRRARIPTRAQLTRYLEDPRGLFWRNAPPAERPLLLDPCEVKTDFARALVPRLDGVLWSALPEGVETIKTFSLNSRERVTGRAVAYEAYVDRLLQCFSNHGHDDAGQQIGELFAFPEMEFGGTWFLLLRRLARTATRNHERTPVLSRAQLPVFYRRLLNDENAERTVRQALGALRAEDEAGPERPSPEVAARPSRARMRSIALADFKGIERLELRLPDDEDAPTVPGRERSVPALLVIGENATGKSSILEAVALTMSTRQARDALGLDPADLLLDTGYVGAARAERRPAASVRIEFDDGSWRALAVTAEGFHTTASTGFQLPPVFAYSAFRQYRDRTRKHSTLKYIQNLFRSEELLSNPERWLLSLDDDRFQMVARALRDILSIERESYDVIERDHEAGRCTLLIDVSEGRGERFSRTPLSVVSSGFRSVLAMVCDVMAGLMDERVYSEFETIRTARGILLVDEIEAHLHPRWKIQIMRGLRNALPNMTILATTHDPLCIRGMGDREVRVLQRVAGEDVGGTDLPTMVEAMTDLPPLSLLQVDQLLTSDAFQLFTTDSPGLDDRFAAVGDLLARSRSGGELTRQELETVASFEADVASALPVGTSAVHRLVQDAVADYLRQLRVLPEAGLRDLREAQRARIVDALKGV